jgi:chromosome segregation ATPase
MANRAKIDRKQLFNWLSRENPHFTVVLRRLCECASPYAKLIGKVCEEFDNRPEPTRNEAIENLERDAEIRSALIEAEIQRETDKILPLKRERFQLEIELDAGQKILSGLNSEIDRLEKLMDRDGVTLVQGLPRKPIQKGADNWNEVLNVDDALLNGDEYRELWLEQQQLLDLLEELKQKLEDCRNAQREERAKYVKRRWRHLLVSS